MIETPEKAARHRDQFEEELDLSKVVCAIGAQKWFVLKVAALFLIIGLGFTFIVPAKWAARTKIFFPNRVQSVLGQAGSFDAGSLGSALTGGTSVPIKVYRGFLESETALDYVVKHVGLKREKVRDMCSFIDRPAESVLEVVVRDNDKELALKIAKLLVDVLKQINAEQQASLAPDDLKILESELAKKKEALRLAEESLRAFQSRSISAPLLVNGSDPMSPPVSVPSDWVRQQKELEVQLAGVNASLEEAEQRMRRLATEGNIPSDLPPVKLWRNKLIDAEYQMKIKEASLGSEAPEMLRLKEVVRTTRQQMESEIKAYLKSLEVKGLDPTQEESRLPSLITKKIGLESQVKALKKLASIAPDEALKLSRLAREVFLNGQIYQRLHVQYQTAILLAERDPNRWQVLDKPRIDERPLNKSYVKASVIGVFVGLLIGCTGAIVRSRGQAR